MSEFVEPNNDYLFQDDLFDDLLNDLVYDDFGGDLVSFPAAEFTVEDNNLANDDSNQAHLNSTNNQSSHEKTEASVPIFTNEYSRSATVPLSTQSISQSQVPMQVQNPAFVQSINTAHNQISPPSITPKHPSSTVSSSAGAKKNKKEKESQTPTVTTSVVATSSLDATIQRIRTLTLLPILIFKAFNGGDLPKVREIIREVTIKDCALKTPALDTEVYGQQYIMDLFQAIYDSHPDAVWVAKQCKLNEETNVIQCRVYFAGTRIAPMFKNNSGSGGGAGDLQGVGHADYLYKKVRRLRLCRRLSCGVLLSWGRSHSRY